MLRENEGIEMARMHRSWDFSGKSIYLKILIFSVQKEEKKKKVSFFCKFLFFFPRDE